MSAAFAACFVVGLLLAVYVMLHGVERHTAPSGRAPHEVSGGHDPRSEPRPLVNGQNVAALLVPLGAAGYLLHRHASLNTSAVVAWALVAGAAGLALSVLLLSAWAVPSARRDVVDERYLMQGHPATVTRAIPAGGEGEIAYEADGHRWVLAARSWDGAAIEAAVDVAIDRVEGGVAYVEEWAQVEARL
jgi:hypothetical protein